jgi:hypothetical protein
MVSAGAIGSSHLLQLSGIGGPEVLQKAFELDPENEAGG